MLKRAFITATAVFAAMGLSLFVGTNNTLAIGQILAALGFRSNSHLTKFAVILFGVALISYLVFSMAKRVFHNKIPDHNRFGQWVWGLTGAYSVIFLSIVFYQDGMAGLFLIVYLFVIYVLISLLWLLEQLVRKFYTKRS